MKKTAGTIYINTTNMTERGEKEDRVKPSVKLNKDH